MNTMIDGKSEKVKKSRRQRNGRPGFEEDSMESAEPPSVPRQQREQVLDSRCQEEPSLQVTGIATTAQEEEEEEERTSGNANYPGAFSIQGETVQRRATGVLSPTPDEPSDSNYQARFHDLQEEYRRVLVAQSTIPEDDHVLVVAAEISSQDDYRERYEALREEYQRALMQSSAPVVIGEPTERFNVAEEGGSPEDDQAVENSAPFSKCQPKGRTRMVLLLCVFVVVAIGATLISVEVVQSNRGSSSTSSTENPNSSTDTPATLDPLSTQAPTSPAPTTFPVTSTIAPTVRMTSSPSMLPAITPETLSPSTPDSPIVGRDICACSPTEFEFTFDFSLTCPPVYILTGDGVNQTSCVTQFFGDNVEGDQTPVVVTRIDILELGPELEILDDEAIIGSFVSGDTYTYTSIVAAGDVSDANHVPRGLQVITTGENAAATTIIQFWLITYSNACTGQPILEVGNSAGWSVFSELDPPNDELCPERILPSTSPPTTEPEAPVIGENLCACSPSSVEFTLDFNRTCPLSDLPTGGGAEIISCSIRVLSDTDDNKTALATRIEVNELGLKQEIISHTPFLGVFLSGDTFSFTSLVATENVTDTSRVPAGLQVILFGKNAAGESILNMWIISYSNECSGKPVLEEQQSVGWTTFVSLEFVYSYGSSA